MRVSLFLDGANFFSMQRDRLHWWIDLRKLLEFARSKGELVDAFYYIGVDVPPDARQQAYLDTVTRLGFSLDVRFISSLPVMRRPACMAWADKRHVQSVGAVS